jgi:hypothetical protein
MCWSPEYEMITWSNVLCTLRGDVCCGEQVRKEGSARRVSLIKSPLLIPTAVS